LEHANWHKDASASLLIMPIAICVEQSKCSFLAVGQKLPEKNCAKLT